MRSLCAVEDSGFLCVRAPLCDNSGSFYFTGLDLDLALDLILHLDLDQISFEHASRN